MNHHSPAANVNNRDDLRTQIIESMRLYCDKYKFYTLNERMMFDYAIMPVLEAAMAAGELLVHRTTNPEKPTAEKIMEWLENMCHSIAKVRDAEATVSKRVLLNVLYIAEEHGLKALADARAERGLRPDTGMPVAGLTIPKKVKP